MTASTASRPTIIVFAREPIAGTAKTRLIPAIGAAPAAALADAFVRDALTKVQHLSRGGLVVAGAAPAGVNRSAYFRRLGRAFNAKLIDQGGGSLGARMARTLDPFAPRAAVLIGTDVPSLPWRHLKKSVELLNRTRVVLGPSLDGGYYLVAVRGEVPDMFRGIKWGGAAVLDRTIKRLHHLRTAFSLGPSWYDVDRPSDLFLLAEHIRRRGPRECPHTASLLRRLKLL